jgi:hypothetical protein
MTAAQRSLAWHGSAHLEVNQDLDLHRFCFGQVLMLCGPLFEGYRRKNLQGVLLEKPKAAGAV